MVPDLTIGITIVWSCLLYSLSLHFFPLTKLFKHCICLSFYSPHYIIIISSPKRCNSLGPRVIPWMSCTFLSKCGLLNAFLIVHHSFYDRLQCLHFSLHMLANFLPGQYKHFHLGSHCISHCRYLYYPSTHSDYTSILPLVFSLTISTNPICAMVKNPFELQEFTQ